MNIEQANGKAMPEILKRLNYTQLEHNNEKIIEKVCAYLQANHENCTREDALRWINNMTGNTHHIASINVPEGYEYNLAQRKSRKLPKEITRTVLKHYIEKRGILLPYAQGLLKEMKVKNPYNDKFTYCLGLKNEKGGYDLRAENFNGSTTPNDITFVRGAIAKPETVHVFRNFIDYLTVITILKKPRLMGDSIILNSMKLLSAATPYIKHYGYKSLYSYMSNDKVGKDAIVSLSNFSNYEQGLIHKPLNKIYIAFKDINQWHIRNLRLST